MENMEAVPAGFPTEGTVDDQVLWLSTFCSHIVERASSKRDMAELQDALRSYKEEESPPARRKGGAKNRKGKSPYCFCNEG